jgi:hypothetical protein
MYNNTKLRQSHIHIVEEAPGGLDVKKEKG